MSIANIGIRWRLIAMITTMIVPILVLIYSNAEQERERMIAQAEADVLAQAQVVTTTHDQVLRTVQHLLDQLSVDPAIREFRDPTCSAVVRRLTSVSGAYSNMAVSGLDGIVHCSANPDGINSLVADRPYYIDALKQPGSVTTSGYLFGRISKKPIDVFATAVLDDQSQPVGVIEISVDIAWLSQLVALQGLRSEVQTTIIGPTGAVLVRSPADEVTTGTEIGDQQWAQEVLAARQSLKQELAVPGSPPLLAAIDPLAPLSGTGAEPPAHVLVTTPKDRALGPAETAFRRNMLVLALVTAVGLAWAWSVSTISVHNPVRALVRASREYAAGRLGARVGLGPLSSGEMVELATAFEVMADTVAEDQEQLRLNATTDRLTGLPNRIEFTRMLDWHFELDPDSPRALLIVQLRSFSSVNATFGFDGGDELLRQVGDRLRETFPDPALVARTAGDEFVVCVTAGPDDRAPWGALESAFGLPFHLDGEPVYLAVRVGSARYPQDAADATVLQRRASLALRRAKQGPRDVAEYEQARDEPRADQIKLLSGLRVALERGGLELHYQPKVNLARNEVVGAEALMRWRREDGSYVPPSEFIPLAEQAGLIGDLTAWALDEAAGQVREWQRAGVSIEVGVNVSASDFDDRRIAEALHSLMSRWQLAPGGIDIEITESSLMADPDEAARACEALREQGYTIAIDDFGTGYSPLLYLQRLPITSIKIDQAFVRDITTNDRSRAIVENTISLAGRFGISTVAEGVETAEIAALLGTLGCEIGQGYHFSRPMPAAQFDAWLRENPLGIGVHAA